MATFTIRPGDSVPSLHPGDTLNLSAGVFGPLYIPGTPNIKVLGAGMSPPGRTIIHGSRSHGDEDPAGIRFADGCENLETGGYLLENPDGRGLFLTAAPGAYVHDIEAYGCGIEGAHVADCPNALLEDLLFHDSRDTGVTSADKRHGLYVAGDMSGAKVRRLTVYNVTGSGIQLNGADHGVILSQFVMEEADFRACGGDGTPTVSLIGASNNDFSKFRERDPRVSWWAVLFSGGYGSRYACRRNVFHDYTVPDGSHIHEEDGSSNNTFAPGAGWSPGDNPQPPDPPRPPVDPKPAILADAQKQSAAIRAALENKTARRIRAAALVPLNLLDADLAALSR